jgi:hypothetical protein
MRLEGAWGAAFHWIALGCETKHQSHQESHARLGTFLRRQREEPVAEWWENLERPLDEPNPSDVDLLAVLDSDDPHVALHQGDALFHTLGLAYNRHLDTPREVQVLFASRTLQEWDPTFIANVARDGIVLFTRGPLPIPFAA